MTDNGIRLPAARPLLRWFAVLSVLMLLMGLASHITQTGLQPALIIEKMLGSAEMLKHYPDARDGFRNPRSLLGIIKIVWPHLMAFGLYGFIVLHLIRAVVGESKMLRVTQAAFYLLAVLELLTPVFFYLMPPVLAAYLRILILLSFCSLVFWLAGWLWQVCGN